MNTKKIVSLFVVLGFVMPLAANAFTLADLQLQLSGLLAQLAALQQQASSASATQTASCTISGGAGVSLFTGVNTQSDCTTQCAAQSVAHPNLSCKWGAVDINPVGSCTVVGGAGVSYFSGTNTRSQCTQQCQINLAGHPSETCTWSGVVFQQPNTGSTNISPNSLYVSPNPCIVGSNGLCSVQVSAKADVTASANSAEIWVGTTGNNDFKLMGCFQTVTSGAAPWVKKGVSLEFRLYKTNGCPTTLPAGDPLASVTVTGVAQLAPYPPKNVGLNKFDLAMQYFGIRGAGSPTTDVVVGTQLAQKAIIDAKRTGAKFLRVSVMGYNPEDLPTIWHANPTAFWVTMDKMMADLNASNMGIVPSFAFNYQGMPGLANERLSAMMNNPNSVSYKLLTQFTDEFINRYKNNPAIYFYELGNEWNLGVDMDQLGGCTQTLGVTQSMCRYLSDYSTNQMIAFSTRFATHIRMLDPTRPITSGYAFPRSAAEHIRAGWLKNPTGGSDWTQDTQQQLTLNLDEIHQGLEIVDTHMYSGPDVERFGLTGVKNTGLVDIAQKAVASFGKSLYIGEFGDGDEMPNPANDPTLPISSAVLQRVVADGISYASAWLWESPVYDASSFLPSLEPGRTDTFIQKLAATNAILGTSVLALPNPDRTAPIIVVTSPSVGTTLVRSGDPTTSCVVTGGAGVILFSGNNTRPQCDQQCQTNLSGHPNETCAWGGSVFQTSSIVGSCSITGGAGGVLFSASNTSYQCIQQCQTSLAVHPAQVCKWNGTVLTASSAAIVQKVVALASDDRAVTRVTLSIDGAVVTTLTGLPYTFTPDTGSIMTGSHQVAVRAYDAAGNYGEYLLSVLNGVVTASQQTAVPVVDTVITASCTVTGGAGLQLFSGTNTLDACGVQCAAQAAGHPNRQCMWGTTDITPTGSCTVAGGAGASLFSGTNTRGQCTQQCQANLVAHPNESCVWNGVKFR